MSTTAKIVIAIVVINSIILFVACLRSNPSTDASIPPKPKIATEAAK